MERLKIDTCAYTSFVQEIANPYAPDLSVQQNQNMNLSFWDH